MKIWLETERLKLTYPHADDFEDQFKLQSDPRVMQHISQGVRTKEQTHQWLEKHIALSEKHGFATGLLRLKDGTVIGRAGMIYLDYDDTQEKIEFGYALFPEYWGQGYATEISKALIEFAFDRLGLKTIYATARLNNHASANVLQKCGMQLEGQVTKAIGTTSNIYKIEKP